jgi:hypothetical protein
VIYRAETNPSCIAATEFELLHTYVSESSLCSVCSVGLSARLQNLFGCQVTLNCGLTGCGIVEDGRHVVLGSAVR